MHSPFSSFPTRSNVADYIYSQYNLKGTEVHLSGDGANWIKRGLDIILGAQFHPDKFHVYKNVTYAMGGDRVLRKRIINGIKLGDSKGVHALYLQRWNTLNEVRMRNRLFESLQYIENNFDNIDLDAYRNCSAEGHVSQFCPPAYRHDLWGGGLSGLKRFMTK